ncbi:MAG: hypothetical protein U0359_31005 [Byssovorax sp.]
MCDGIGHCVACLTDADCLAGGPPTCAGTMFTGASKCNADNACVPGDTINCADQQKLCTLDGCVQCLTDMDCGADPLGGCAHNVCEAGTCIIKKAPQATPCPQFAAKSCNGKGACVPTKYVFVTAAPFGSALNGANGADLKCSGAAMNANLGGQWVSWTTDAISQPVMRLMPGQTPYQLLDGTPVLNSGTDLAASAAPLIHGIDLDETFGLQTGELVWTGTKGNGGDGTCSNWTGVNPSITNGIAGQAGLATINWDKGVNLMCNAMAHLYCFQK